MGYRHVTHSFESLHNTGKFDLNHCRELIWVEFRTGAKSHRKSFHFFGLCRTCRYCAATLFPWEEATVRIPRLRFTMRWLLVAVALVALGLGLAVESSRLRRLAATYRAIQARHAIREVWQRGQVEALGRMRRLMPQTHRYGRVLETASSEALAAYHGGMARKYGEAAGRPWWSIAPDPLPPTAAGDVAGLRAAVLSVAMRAADAEQLDLMGTPIEDSDLPRLAELRGLRELNLTDTRVTDTGLRHLKALPELRRVALGGTKVTASGARRLAAETDGLTVIYDPPTSTVAQ